MFINVYTILLFSFSIFILWFFFFKKTKKEKPNHVVLTIKNAESYIEGLVRTYSGIINRQELTGNHGTAELYIIDKGSTDSTPVILEKLTKNYSFVHPVTKSPYNNYEKSNH